MRGRMPDACEDACDAWRDADTKKRPRDGDARGRKL